MLFLACSEQWNATELQNGTYGQDTKKMLSTFANLGTDHKKRYGGGGEGGIFEPQEFFFVIKFLLWIF